MNRKSFLSRVLLGLAAMMVVPLLAAEPPVISALRADKARLAAMMSGNGEALARLMSDQLRFVHSDGRVE